MDDTQVSQNGSRSENMICKEGIVRAVHGDTIDVEVTVRSACAGCHAKSICIPSEQRQETVPAVVPAGLTFPVAGRVDLGMGGWGGGEGAPALGPAPLGGGGGGRHRRPLRQMLRHAL